MESLKLPDEPNDQGYSLGIEHGYGIERQRLKKMGISQAEAKRRERTRIWQALFLRDLEIKVKWIGDRKFFEVN